MTAGRLAACGRCARLAVLLLVACANAWSQAGAKADRVAPVIGNSAYQFAPLDNPRNDARAMSALMAEAGFTVQSEVDTSLQVLQSAVERFGKVIRDP